MPALRQPQHAGLIVFLVDAGKPHHRLASDTGQGQRLIERSRECLKRRTAIAAETDHDAHQSCPGGGR